MTNAQEKNKTFIQSEIHMKIREAKEQERKENKSQMIQIIILWT
jgi:hypothetical protein